MAFGDVIRSWASPSLSIEGIAWDGVTLWELDNLLDKGFQLDHRDGAIIFSRDISTVPTGLVFADGVWWDIDRGSDNIRQVDVVSGVVIRSHARPGGTIRGLAFDGRTLWHTDTFLDQVFQIDPRTGVTIRSWATPSGAPHGLAFHLGYMFIHDQNTDLLSQVDPRDGTVIRSAAIPNPVGGIGISDVGLWVADSVAKTTLQIDLN